MFHTIWCRLSLRYLLCCWGVYWISWTAFPVSYFCLFWLTSRGWAGSFGMHLSWDSCDPRLKSDNKRRDGTPVRASTLPFQDIFSPYLSMLMDIHHSYQLIGQTAWSFFPRQASLPTWARWACPCFSSRPSLPNWFIRLEVRSFMVPMGVWWSKSWWVFFCSSFIFHCI